MFAQADLKTKLKKESMQNSAGTELLIPAFNLIQYFGRYQ